MMPKANKVLRQSTTFSTPQSYVTIEIRNKNINKKLSHHRSSVLNQLRATQSILNDSLIKSIPLVKSTFLTPKPSKFNLKKQLQSSTLSSLLRCKQKKLKQNRRNEGEFQSKYRVAELFKNKLKQITNISHHFEQACIHKGKKLKTQACQIEDNYLLPTLNQHSNIQTANPMQDVKVNKNWLRKLRNGRSLAEKLKKRLSNVKLSLPLRQQISNQNRVECQRKSAVQSNQKQSEAQVEVNKNSSLQDIYFTRLERKTAPTSHRTNTFYRMFCSNKESLETTLRDTTKIEQEQVRKLQQFVSGAQPSEFKQYDNLINIKEFLKDRQNFDVLKRMYSHVKQKYALEFKQINEQSIKQSNLLALVYYLQNKSNMSEHEKKNWKSKMRLFQ